MPQRATPFFRKSQKTRQPTVQEMNGVQSWISPPPLMAIKQCKTNILGALIVSERGFLEPHQFPERRAVESFISGAREPPQV